MVIREMASCDAEAVARLHSAADDARVISSERVEHLRRAHPERSRAVSLVAESGGAVVGLGSAGLDTSSTAAGVAWAFVTVDPAYRREGIGDELGRRLLDHLHEVGATKATSFFRWSEEGERWASVRGWSRLLGGPLIAVDPRIVRDRAVPAGYSCVPIAETAPEAVFEVFRVTALDEPTPFPHDDVRLDDLLRIWNDPNADLGASTAVLDGAGRVVAFTFLKIAGDRAQHGGTGTLREHRGRGLATAAKRRALRAAAERGVTRVTTSNEEDNAEMRAINGKLGFEPIGEHVIFGRDLPFGT